MAFGEFEEGQGMLDHDNAPIWDERFLLNVSAGATRDQNS